MTTNNKCKTIWTHTVPPKRKPKRLMLHLASLLADMRLGSKMTRCVFLTDCYNCIACLSEYSYNNSCSSGSIWLLCRAQSFDVIFFVIKTLSQRLHLSSSADGSLDGKKELSLEDRLVLAEMRGLVRKQFCISTDKQNGNSIDVCINILHYCDTSSASFGMTVNPRRRKNNKLFSTFVKCLSYDSSTWKTTPLDRLVPVHWHLA
jgi:hypothetical protein